MKEEIPDPWNRVIRCEWCEKISELEANPGDDDYVYNFGDVAYCGDCLERFIPNCPDGHLNVVKMTEPNRYLCNECNFDFRWPRCW